MTTATKERKRTSRPRGIPKGCFKPKDIPAKWVRILKRIPGYDSIATAGKCYFDPDAAEHALDFFPECIRHVKGPLAGRPFELMPWQTAFVANLFGWKRPDGTRRYRAALLYVAKKNGKTTMGAGLILYMLIADGELGAEIYSAACSREQSSLVFDHAAGMVKLDPDLHKRLEVYGDSGGGQHKTIVYVPARSFYRPLAADAATVDGVNPSLSYIDEVHRHKKRELADLLEESGGARTQPMVIYTTTADYARESLCNELLEYAQRVRSGVTSDVSFLPVIYETDKEDDWKDPKVWKKANPNLGVTVMEEDLAERCAKAQERPILENSFRRLRLNQVTEQIDRWIPMDKWAACAGMNGLDPLEWRAKMLEDLRGHQCYGGLDLGSVADLSSLGLLFEDPEDLDNLIILPWFWMPQDTVARKDPRTKQLLDLWLRQGFITPTEGNTADYDLIRTHITGRYDENSDSDFEGLAERYGIRQLAVDRLFQGAQLCTQLMGDGLDVYSFGQGFLSMTAPSKAFEERVIAGTIIHGNNPVLNWMAANVTVKHGEQETMKPMKPGKNSPLKVDGIIVTVMALGRAICQEDGDSVYEDEDESIFL